MAELWPKYVSPSMGIRALFVQTLNSCISPHKLAKEAQPETGLNHHKFLSHKTAAGKEKGDWWDILFFRIGLIILQYTLMQPKLDLLVRVCSSLIKPMLIQSKTEAGLFCILNIFEYKIIWTDILSLLNVFFQDGFFATLWWLFCRFVTKFLPL